MGTVWASAQQPTEWTLPSSGAKCTYSWLACSARPRVVELDDAIEPCARREPGPYIQSDSMNAKLSAADPVTGKPGSGVASYPRIVIGRLSESDVNPDSGEATIHPVCVRLPGPSSVRYPPSSEGVTGCGAGGRMVNVLPSG